MTLFYSSLQFSPVPQEQSDKALWLKEAFIVRNMVSEGGFPKKTIEWDRVKASTHQHSMEAAVPEAVFHSVLQTGVPTQCKRTQQFWSPHTYSGLWPSFKHTVSFPGVHGTIPFALPFGKWSQTFWKDKTSPLLRDLLPNTKPHSFLFFFFC